MSEGKQKYHDKCNGSSQQDAVILIHGTAAGHSDDIGERWWQRNSPFHRALCSSLSSIAEVQPENIVFHWSGNNSEADRRAAGDDLYIILQRLEDEERPFHIVGHSHGGSVIWNALKRSAQLNHQLKYLRSWTSVATPFMQFKTEPINLWIIAPLLVSLLGILSLIHNVVPYFQHAVEIYREGQVLSVIALPVFFMLLVSVFLIGVFSIIRPIVKRNKLARDRQAEVRANRWYNDKWMGVWSPEDEAINGLILSQGMQGNIIPRMQQKRKGNWHYLLSITMWPVRAIYNFLVASAGDAFIWTRLSNRLQGNDWPGVEMLRVSRHPTLGCPTWPAVNESIQQELVKFANRHAAETLASVRNTFGFSAQTGQNTPTLFENIKEKLSFSELVHTSYFDIDDVVKLIALFITGQSTKSNRVLNSFIGKDSSDKLAKWQQDIVKQRKVELGRYVKTQTDLVSNKQNRSNLHAIIQITLALIGSFIWLAAASINENTVKPYTDEFQIQSILQAAPIQEIATSGRKISTDALSNYLTVILDSGLSGQVTEKIFAIENTHLRHRQSIERFKSKVSIQSTEIASEYSKIEFVKQTKKATNIALIEAVNKINGKGECSYGVGDTSLSLASVGLLEQAQKASDKALEIANNINSEGDCLEELFDIALKLAAAGFVDHAEIVTSKTVKCIKDHNSTLYRLRTLGKITPKLVEAGLEKQAIKTGDEALKAVQELKRTDNELEDLTYYLYTAGLEEQALKAALSISDEVVRIKYLGLIVLILDKAGKRELALKSLKGALVDAQKIYDIEKRSAAMSYVSSGFARLKHFRKARIYANECGVREDKLVAYSEIIKAYYDMKNRS